MVGSDARNDCDPSAIYPFGLQNLERFDLTFYQYTSVSIPSLLNLNLFILQLIKIESSLKKNNFRIHNWLFSVVKNIKDVYQNYTTSRSYILKIKIDHKKSKLWANVFVTPKWDHYFRKILADFKKLIYCNW